MPIRHALCILPMILLAACAHPDPLLGKWKVVKMTLERGVADEKQLGQYYFEFLKDGDVWVTAGGKHERKSWEHKGDSLFSKEDHARWKIEKLDAHGMILSGISQEHEKFSLELRRVTVKSSE